MNYKYQRRQILGKRLKVPKTILLRIYNNKLSFDEFIEYELDDKIPISCLIESDRKIVEKFGLDRAKALDWELLNTPIYLNNINFKELMMSIDASVENLNASLYELAKDKIRPNDYSAKMKEAYSSRLFNIPQDASEHLKSEMMNFNRGKTDLKELIQNWSLYKEKDLSCCLQNDERNEYNITDSQLKEFMHTYENIVGLIADRVNIYQFIHNIVALETDSEKREYIKSVTDKILASTTKVDGYSPLIELSNEEYRALFKYSSMKEFLYNSNKYYESYIDNLLEELKTLPEDYIFNIPIPFSVLNDSNVLSFVGTYGLKNTVDFDNECGQFFTKNNYKMLRLMNDMYLHYANNIYDPKKKFNNYRYYFDENGQYVKIPYTKDEFYEAMRRMIVYGPSNGAYKNKAPNYKDITGEFRIRNADLFLSSDAPDELQAAFYNGSITPSLIFEHPEYKQYLNGKNLSVCFKRIEISVDSVEHYENFYSFLEEKIGFDGVMDFIIEYRDIISSVFDQNLANSYKYKIMLSKEDTLENVKSKLNTTFKHLIIEKGVVYPQNIPRDLIANYPSLFLDPDAPIELQKAFYERTINPSFILSNPVYQNHLKTVDLEILYKYMPVRKIDNNGFIIQNLVSAIRQTFGIEESFKIMLEYGKYIEKIWDAKSLDDYKFNPNISMDDFLNEIDAKILKSIIDGQIKYDADISSHFQKENPTLFLDPNVSLEVRNKFYNKEFTLEDFVSDPSLLDLFGSTNVICGLQENIAWMIPLFGNYEDLKKANEDRLKVASQYLGIDDYALREAFKEYVIEFGDYTDINKFNYILEVLSRLSLSNSNEIFTFRKELAAEILRSTNPIESLNKIEDVFIKNNIPTIGKIYSCFEILHPNFKGFQFDNSMISPILANSSILEKKVIVFSDLLKASMGSNNRSLNGYLKNIENASRLYNSLRLGEIQYDNLDKHQIDELDLFRHHLATLYNNTMRGKTENTTFEFTDNIERDISELAQKLSPNGSLDYDLANRVIRMFCGFTGLNTLDQIKSYIESKIKTADSRNRISSNAPMTLEVGDFIKGIGKITYLKNILQNGSVSKEYLGSNAESDATPLDTDVSMIIESEGTTLDKINSTVANEYGPIWFVLKNDGRFNITRNAEGPIIGDKDLSKIEAFYTGVCGKGHYGIRTGFASSEINYIVMENYDPRVGLEIAMNGFYIPIANKNGKIIFTPNDYDMIRAKMKGLSYYGDTNYDFSKNLVTEEVLELAAQIEQSNYEVQIKRDKINDIIKSSLEKMGLHLKTNMDGDLTEGFVELIDTGSTGRGTNMPGEGDFDFMMRIDNAILSNPSKLQELKDTILKSLRKDNMAGVTNDGDFRLKSVQIEDEEVDIDITFTKKTNNVSYSTDMAIQDRLSTIQRSNPEKYKYVIANILLAKKVLKKAECYKPDRGEVPQGGLGGIGIENWILQNGGSFVDAASSFIEAAEGKNFEEFKSIYQVWDFGENYLAEKKGLYSHDNFVENNMNASGYYKMVEVLKEYINAYTNQQNEKLNKI